MSLVVWKIEPWASSSWRSSAALTRLPLCTRASGPMPVITTTGWALATMLEPAVE